MHNRKLAKKILSHLEANLYQNLSLEQLAKDLNYSKFYLARTFKTQTGITIYKYLQSRRLNEAAQQLVKGNQTILEIALEAGYNSQQAFTQAFRRTYQCTPQEYRKTGQYPKQNKIDLKTEIENVCSIWCKGGKMAA